MVIQSVRIVNGNNGNFLTRNYATGVWGWTPKSCDSHFFVSRKEAERVVRSIPACCRAAVR